MTRPSTANGGFPNVVVTAVTATTSIAADIESTWKGLLAGDSGIRVLTDDFVTKWDLQVRIGGHLKEPIDPQMSRLDMRRMSYVQRMAKLLSGQLWETAGSPEVDPDRFAVVIGTGLGGGEKIVETYDAMNEGGPRKVSPFYVPSTIINMIAGQVSMMTGAKGPNIAAVTACTTATHNIGLAMRMIQYGDADAMIAGGAEFATTPTSLGGFCAMKALSTRNDDPQRASRPWDEGRDGFVMGDGAGILVLEEYERAKARGARIYAELAGFGMSGDAYHMTAPSENGEGGARCMVAAIRDAGIDPSQVGYINAHGTSTPAGDLAETMGIKSVLGEHARKVMVSSTKSMTGHPLGAAGGVEAVFSAMALHTGVIPPTINLDNPGEGCDLDYVPHVAREQQVDIALSNSFGFGGTNGTLVFRRA